MHWPTGSTADSPALIVIVPASQALAFPAALAQVGVCQLPELPPEPLRIVLEPRLRCKPWSEAAGSAQKAIQSNRRLDTVARARSRMGFMD